MLILAPAVRLVLSSLGLTALASWLWLRVETLAQPSQPSYRRGGRIQLPMPELSGVITLEQALASRRSIREYRSEPITMRELAQLLWSAYGITETRWGFKTTPSAGATYPLEIYAVVRNVEGLEPGAYRYLPHSHELEQTRAGELNQELYSAALEQEWVLKAQLNIVITAVYSRTTRRYGERGVRYVFMEAGHACQNVYLQATALGLGAVAIGAFNDDEIARIVGAGEEEHAIYMIALGRPVKQYRITLEELSSYYTARRLTSS